MDVKPEPPLDARLTHLVMVVTEVLVTRRHNWPFAPGWEPRRVPIRRSPSGNPWQEPPAPPAPEPPGITRATPVPIGGHAAHGRAASPGQAAQQRDSDMAGTAAPECNPEEQRTPSVDATREREASMHTPVAQDRESAQVGELRAEIERLQKLVAEKDQKAREAAVLARASTDELERAKERIRKDADRELEQRKRTILLAFLDVIDDLDRALDAARQSSPDTPVVSGIGLVRKGFSTRLGQFDVMHMPALGQRFDPGRHEAVSMIPVTDPAKDGMVLAVVREGYAAGNEVLRPANVVVGKLFA